MTNICSIDLAASRDFYTLLFDFKVDFESDWFIHLVSPNNNLELGIIDVNHKIVPKAYKERPQGFYTTFVVDNVDSLYELALTANLEIVSKPENTFYGQRRLLLKDPDGTLVDISFPL